MSATTTHRPTHREALWALEAAFDRGDLITVFGRCTVEYNGRASAELGAGDRLVILKPDGTALVHTDENQKPVNWQPPGCTHYAAVREGRLRIRSERSSPEERLDVCFERIEQLCAYPVTGGRSPDLLGSEADLKDYLLAHPDRIEPGFTPIEAERQSSAGPMDIFGRDADGVPVVVELKRRRVGPSAVSQLERYVNALRREIGDKAAVRGVLVAPSVTDRTAELLEQRGFGFVALDPTAPESDEQGRESIEAADRDDRSGDEDDRSGDEDDRSGDETGV
ncbi:endonuclease NucS [Halalkalirubrum salinum]|uniref:endonuclease NucS n=1 Tax=Halalkalirubrum salinum TaxID=2563889 RepID=UPI0010FB2074|nr:endonuclease NucS [Halalkalirubrum salinum]